MYDIISCATYSRLHAFPHLGTVSEYRSGSTITPVDCHFISRKNVLLQSAEKTGFTVLLIKPSSKKLCPLRKFKVENLKTTAAAKNSTQFAFGLSDGTIKVAGFKSDDFKELEMGHKLKPETTSSPMAPLSLDFSCCGEYLSVVYETGASGLFGLKTGIRVDPVAKETDCMMSRFHPTKRHSLAFASVDGHVRVHDIGHKRLIFQQRNAHKAICKELSWSLAAPDLLFSVGLDKWVNVFDLRRGAIVHRVQHMNLLTTMSAAECGTFFAVGSQLGEVAIYDLRSLRKPIGETICYSESINRVAFAPTSDIALCDLSGESSVEHRSVDASPNIVASTSESNDSSTGDSFVARIQAMAASRTRVSDIRRRSSSGSRLSMGGPAGGRLSMDWQSRNFMDALNVSNTSFNSMILDGASNMKRRKLSETEEAAMLKALEKLDESEMNEEPEAEAAAAAGTAAITNTPKSRTTPATINGSVHHEGTPDFLGKLLSDQQSTPHSAPPGSDSAQNDGSEKTKTPPAAANAVAFDMSALMEALDERLDRVKRELSDKILDAEESVRFDMERVVPRVFRITEQLTDGICAHLERQQHYIELLMRRDKIYEDYFKLEEENKKLRLMLESQRD